LTTQKIGNGGAVTTAAATAGGDTIERSSIAGGWMHPVYLVVVVGATATTVTVDGVAGAALTNATAHYLVPNGTRGTRANITYSQATSVTVGAVSLGASGIYTSYGT
jgi:hypothetical protein